MDVEFRKIGFFYAVLCFLGSEFGAIIFFKRMVEASFVCCENGYEHVVFYTIGLVMFLLSATIAVFLKIGIEEAEPLYIRIHKWFMLSRTFLLTARWTYESISLKIAQIDGDASSGVTLAQNTATLLLLGISVLLGLEIWVINGIQRYVEQRLRDEENDEILHV